MVKIKDYDTFGKVKKVVDELIGGEVVTDIEQLRKILLRNKKEFALKTKMIEIKGVENYAQQFQEFVNGFSSAEAPYIFAGMKCCLDLALSSQSFTDKLTKEKYDSILELLDATTTRVITTIKSTKPFEE